ncbi:hypothetical protein PCC9214_03426 [Planktothrix tepida]|uniref:Transglycosylase SLT domain-containing protein n=2 Tax=Planktothrix TaxID=54304 RepID=A0A1J1LT09_9CYAN|nr:MULTISPECIES: hypothetical protein [Planktothrix]CAD5945894.1 hypothetical protein NO713_02229 [Planktothrix pseudagardhii]CAD5964855.1 hypothetical protein PCC9214_03426 [Planktothrix tepida]CUR34972.1 conserved exported hypothetical protein [Planktothrix tepida PCC 9214]
MKLKWELIAGLLLVWTVPVFAQVSNTQVQALVEALRLAAPQTGTPNDGLYSAWQIKPENIPRWSKLCIGEEMTPAQFEADQTKAKQVLGCVMGDVLKEEYPKSQNNEAIAIRRAAAWWMTGDPNQYNQGQTATYTQKVLQFYEQQRS